MPNETIVAVFDTAAHADAAIRDLMTAGIPASSIEHYAQDAESAGINTANSDVSTHEHRGFWGWLTGGDEVTQGHHALYDQSIKSGGTVVTVIANNADVEGINQILDRHSPIDMDERHSQYSSSGSYGMAAASTAATSGTTVPSASVTTAGGSTEEVIALSEETLAVGKREVDRGTTRVRRYVTERPIEEQVRLRNESVSVFRRPVTGAVAVGADAFTNREITMTETDEEAVVAKSAHVVEEVVVQKGVEERVETIKDTLRREEVEIEGPSAQSTTTSTGTIGTDKNRMPGI
ncbi:MAG: YsnF/AvaK domain-containing protein [Janthinobacterium lividum]